MPAFRMYEKEMPKVPRKRRAYRLSDEEYAKVREILMYLRSDEHPSYAFDGDKTDRKLRNFRMSDEENDLIKRVVRLWKVNAPEELIREELTMEHAENGIYGRRNIKNDCPHTWNTNGGTRKLTDEDKKEIEAQLRRGIRTREIARQFNVSRQTIYNVKKELNLNF